MNKSTCAVQTRVVQESNCMLQNKRGFLLGELGGGSGEEGREESLEVFIGKTLLMGCIFLDGEPQGAVSLANTVTTSSVHPEF